MKLKCKIGAAKAPRNVNKVRPKFARSMFSILAVVSVSVFGPGMAFAETANVIITIPVDTAAPDGFRAKLASWKHSGVVSDILWLDSEKAEGRGFSSVAILEFPTTDYYSDWQKNGALTLSPSLIVKRADVFTHGEKTPRDSNNSVFKINEYKPLVSSRQYDKFADGYIQPLMQRQVDAKLMMRYTMYQERESDGFGKVWLFVEYKDPVSFRRAGPIKEGIRADLTRNDRAYRNLHPIKDTLRVKGHETMATYRELPPPALPNLPGYEPEYAVKGGFRIIGSELKNAVGQLAKGFGEFHPDAKITTSHIPSSEGGIAGLYFNLSDVAPMGDDAKITDMMPFYNTFKYMPTEISVATGGYEKRGSLFAWAIVTNKDNPINDISLEELKGVFGAQRTGGWELVDHNYKFSSKYARSAKKDIRTWGELGVRGKWAQKPIDPFGYAAPGFATYFERNWFHWSKKWNPAFREYVEEKQTSPGPMGAKLASTVPLEDLLTNKYAIGIAGLMHVKKYPELKVLGVSEKKGGKVYKLTPDNVATRKYPLIRDAFFYVNKAPNKAMDPRVREFMRYVLSREGQEIIARVGYYYPLDKKTLEGQLKKLDEDMVTSSHYRKKK